LSGARKQALLPGIENLFASAAGNGRKNPCWCGTLSWRTKEGKTLRILGIDPGTAITGYGVLEQQGNKLIPLSYGVIRTGPELGLAQRLNIIYDEVSKKIKLYQPDTMAVEQLFFNKNVRTALVVGHARGVILLCGSQANLPVVEYTPLQVKSAVVGYGTAEKKQVQEMVRILLGLEKIPKPDDAADALAIAICHAHSRLGREYERRCRG